MDMVQKLRDLSRPVRRRVRDMLTARAPVLPRLQHRDEEPRPQFPAAAEALSARWAQYRAAEVDLTIAEHDDMFVAGQLAHYLFVGTSALEVISEAMLLARKTRFAKVLDVPCGYGRVTRHLVKFFPEAEIFVSEIDKAKQNFCVSTFGARAIDLPSDFSGAPAELFDLIFVGSLFTHLNAALSLGALRYLLDALSQGGLLIFTTHGRHATALPASEGQLEQKTLRDFMRTGFGYDGGVAYGNSRIAPSWVVRAVESMPDARIVAHKEQGWALHQDVFVIEKAAGWTWPRPM
jgi:SAM-dependent methyltransferase